MTTEPKYLLTEEQLKERDFQVKELCVQNFRSEGCPDHTIPYTEDLNFCLAAIENCPSPPLPEAMNTENKDQFVYVPVKAVHGQRIPDDWIDYRHKRSGYWLRPVPLSSLLPKTIIEPTNKWPDFDEQSLDIIIEKLLDRGYTWEGGDLWKAIVTQIFGEVVDPMQAEIIMLREQLGEKEIIEPANTSARLDDSCDAPFKDNNSIEQQIAKYIERYRNEYAMTSNRIARNVIKLIQKQ